VDTGLIIFQAVYQLQSVSNLFFSPSPLTAGIIGIIKNTDWSVFSSPTTSNNLSHGSWRK
jgi:hypothetical protein